MDRNEVGFNLALTNHSGKDRLVSVKEKPYKGKDLLGRLGLRIPQHLNIEPSIIGIGKENYVFV